MTPLKLKQWNDPLKRCDPITTLINTDVLVGDPCKVCGHVFYYAQMKTRCIHCTQQEARHIHERAWKTA